jgi:hypothetical protein
MPAITYPPINADLLAGKPGSRISPVWSRWMLAFFERSGGQSSDTFINVSKIVEENNFDFNAAQWSEAIKAGDALREQSGNDSAAEIAELRKELESVRAELDIARATVAALAETVKRLDALEITAGFAR